jgi:hypothetical protein
VSVGRDEGVVLEVDGCFCWWRRARMDCVECEERIVDTWSVRCDLREETRSVRRV